MKRWLRRAGARLAPERLKSRVRGRLYGYKRSRMKLAFSVSNDESGLFILIDNRIKLYVTKDDLDDFTFHFVSNGASIEEMYGFVKAADTARTLFDVGAHKGLFSLVFCGCNQANKAIAYEPSPSLVRGAEKLARMNWFQSRISLEPFAIGDKRDIVTASLDSSEFIRFGSEENRDQEIDVQMTTLDEECSRLGIYPDIVKIDIEGYEHEALLGARDMLKRKKPVICLELHLDLLEQRGINPRIICNDLQGYGYQFFSYEGRRMAARDVYDSIDAVFRFIAT
ncbi:MAG TPA: FkbM family methyltransferase [Blastocatellia bacterium]|nr:FkbM family methyltransferase [Blastocatellia bacterium]